MPDKSVLYQVIDALSKKIPEMAAKHPVTTAAAGGLAYGLSELDKPVHQLEGSIMREYAEPDNKYSSVSLDKFAERKADLAAKIMFIKSAANDDFDPDEFEVDFKDTLRGGVNKGLGGSIGKEGIGAIRRLLGMTAQSIHERLMQDPKRQRLMNHLIESDPDIASYEQNQPGGPLQAYTTMARYAPGLSMDTNIARSFLRQAAMSGGPIDHTMVKGLADAELAIQKAQNEGAWLRGGF